MLNGDWKGRVTDEWVELAKKEVSLSKFTKGDVFASLKSEEQALLLLQLEIMGMYCRTLSRRVCQL